MDERLDAEFDLCREALTWKKHFINLDSKFSAAVNAEPQTSWRNTELATRLAIDYTRRSRMADARAPVFVSMTIFDAVVEGIHVWMGEMMDKLQMGLANLIRTGPRASCEELINFPVAEFTAASVETQATIVTGSLPTSKAFAGGEILMDLDDVPPELVPLSLKLVMQVQLRRLCLTALITRVLSTFRHCML